MEKKQKVEKFFVVEIVKSNIWLRGFHKIANEKNGWIKMVPFLILRGTAKQPEYVTEGAAGFDLSAAEEYTLQPFERAKIPTGIAFAVPSGFELNIRNRSGITLKTPLIVWEGTVDSDFRGEVHIIVQNLSMSPFTIYTGERIAQGVISPVVRAEFTQQPFLDSTERGEGGFGHTGK